MLDGNTSVEMQQIKMDNMVSGQSADASSIHRDNKARIGLIIVGVSGLAVGAVVMHITHVTLVGRRRRALAEMASPAAVGYIELAISESHSHLLQEQDEVECEIPKSSSSGTDQ